MYFQGLANILGPNLDYTGHTLVRAPMYNQLPKFEAHWQATIHWKYIGKIVKCWKNVAKDPVCWKYTGRCCTTLASLHRLETDWQGPYTLKIPL